MFEAEGEKERKLGVTVQRELLKSLTVIHSNTFYQRD